MLQLQQGTTFDYNKNYNSTRCILISCDDVSFQSHVINILLRQDHFLAQTFFYRDILHCKTSYSEQLKLKILSISIPQSQNFTVFSALLSPCC